MNEYGAALKFMPRRLDMIAFIAKSLCKAAIISAMTTEKPTERLLNALVLPGELSMLNEEPDSRFTEVENVSYSFPGSVTAVVYDFCGWLIGDIAELR